VFKKSAGTFEVRYSYKNRCQTYYYCCAEIWFNI